MYVYMCIDVDIDIDIDMIRFHYGSKCFTDLKCPIHFPPVSTVHGSIGPPWLDKSNVVDDSPKTDAEKNLTRAENRHH